MGKVLNQLNFYLGKNSSLILLSLIYSICCVILFYSAQQSEFISIIFPYSIAFVAYILMYYLFNPSYHIKLIIFLALLVRVTSLFYFPHLSNDIYRFWWDGELINSGINPFNYTPKQIMDLELIRGETVKLCFDKMNSPEYFTVYPPLCQLLFSICSKISGENLYLFSLLLKITFFITEIFSFKYFNRLLKITNSSPKILFLIFLNPLLILECYGNLHFEIILINFLIISIVYLYESKMLHSGFALGISAISKLTSLILVPFYILKNIK
ncbi:MAG: hypothetical protein ABIO44_06100, partial [Saprospiraceae bacterium]